MDDVFDSEEQRGTLPPSCTFQEITGESLAAIEEELQSYVESGELYDFSVSYDVVTGTRVVGGAGYSRGRVRRSANETVRLHAITTEAEDAAYPSSAEVRSFEHASSDDLYSDITASIEEEQVLALDIASYSENKERGFIGVVLADDS